MVDHKPELVNFGVHGCVFRPAFQIAPCTNEEIYNKEYGDKKCVSKLFYQSSDLDAPKRARPSDVYDDEDDENSDREDFLVRLKNNNSFDREIEINVLIDRLIDPCHHFTPRLISICNSFPVTKEIKAILESCACPIDGNRSLLYHIKYEDVGLNMKLICREWFHENVFIHNFAIHLESLFYGIAELEKHGMVHMDIKPDNILFDREGKRGTLIDFEKMTCFKSVYRERNIFHFRHARAEFIYYPPEFIIFLSFLQSAMKHTNPTLLPYAHELFIRLKMRYHYDINWENEINKRQDDFIQKIERCIDDKEQKRCWKEILGQFDEVRGHYSSRMCDLESFFFDKEIPDMIEHACGKEKQMKIIKYWFHFYAASKIDVFSLGMVLRECIAEYIYMYLDKMEPNSHKIHFNFVCFLKFWMKHLIFPMIEIDPVKRMSSREAYQTYNTLKQKYRARFL